MIDTIKKKLPKVPKPVVLSNFGGLDLSGDGTQIDERRSPDMLNMITDQLGALDKRPGYQKLYSEPVDAIRWTEAYWATHSWTSTTVAGTKVNGLINYTTQAGTVTLLMANSSNLYTWSPSGGTPSVIYSGLADHEVSHFVMNDKLYLLDGTNYLQYDGTTVTNVTSIAYVPTITLATPPAGGGTVYEDLNLLSPSFKQSYSADGSTATFVLALTGLDATTVSATVNGVAKAETADFTVDRTNGKVVFNSVPTSGTDNVVITAHKTQSGFADRIKKCQFAALFGGSNDTRVFVSGNPNYICQDWRSGLYDPTYFPENGYYRIGRTNEAVMGYSIQYDTMVIHKENSTWQRFYESTSSAVTFPLKPINDTIGCVARRSAQVLENNPTVLTKKGVYQLVGGSVRDERNMKHISVRIDNALLAESTLSAAKSIDYDNKYYLALNGNVYIYDYLKDEWFLFDNINASCFLEYDNRLYFGSSDNGMIYKFNLDTEINAYYDDGEAITAYWKSKLLNMNTFSFRKTVNKIFTTIKPAVATSAEIYYVTDRVVSQLLTTIYQSTVFQNLFSYIFLDYSRFSYGVNTGTSKTKKTKLKAKKFVLFQIEYKNAEPGESLGLISCEIDYDYISQVK